MIGIITLGSRSILGQKYGMWIQIKCTTLAFSKTDLEWRLILAQLHEFECIFLPGLSDGLAHVKGMHFRQRWQMLPHLLQGKGVGHGRAKNNENID